MGAGADCKFMMYGPAYRDAKNFDCYDINFDRLFAALKERFGREHWSLLLWRPGFSLRTTWKKS